MMGTLKAFLRNERAAVAPIVALSLIGLIASGGIAFDYARLATMDTELQQAADQAALAAASQLDRVEDEDVPANSSQARAIKAISDGDGDIRLTANLTRFANDDDGAAIELETITFCSAYDDSAPSATACTVAEDSSDSKYVVVKTTVRTANYLFTPIVAAFSDTASAEAVAGLESAICNVAPLLVCAPSDNLGYPTASEIGHGIRLKPMPANEWAPGNYGMLDFGSGTPGVTAALLGHGLNGCLAEEDTSTEPGVKEVTDAINTRLDVYAGHQSDPAVCAADGTGCPAPNAGKDMVRTETYEKITSRGAAQPVAPACGAATGDGTAYDGTFTASPWEQSNTLKSYTRDACHLTSSCVQGVSTDSNFGNGAWAFDDYMAANHPSIAAGERATTVGGTSRYKVYKWELESGDASDPMRPRMLPGDTATPRDGKVRGVDKTFWTFTKQCSHKRPVQATRTYTAQKDRRLLPIIVADCTDLNGKGEAGKGFTLLHVFDVFITEPSLDRGPASARITDNKEIYGEVVGPAETVAGGSGFQYYSRRRPYLIR